MWGPPKPPRENEPWTPASPAYPHPHPHPQDALAPTCLELQRGVAARGGQVRLQHNVEDAEGVLDAEDGPAAPGGGQHHHPAEAALGGPERGARIARARARAPLLLRRRLRRLGRAQRRRPGAGAASVQQPVPRARARARRRRVPLHGRAGPRPQAEPGCSSGSSSSARGAEQRGWHGGLRPGPRRGPIPGSGSASAGRAPPQRRGS